MKNLIILLTIAFFTAGSLSALAQTTTMSSLKTEFTNLQNKIHSGKLGAGEKIVEKLMHRLGSVAIKISGSKTCGEVQAQLPGLVTGNYMFPSNNPETTILKRCTSRATTAVVVTNL